jgi:hypothetical protein
MTAPSVSLVIIGVLLILFGVATTPFYQPVGNAAFWLGIPLLALGILLILAKA